MDHNLHVDLLRKHSWLSILLNQARTWFLEITFMWACMRVCICECAQRNWWHDLEFLIGSTISVALQFHFMALAIDVIDTCGLSKEICH